MDARAMNPNPFQGCEASDHPGGTEGTGGAVPNDAGACFFGMSGPQTVNRFPPPEWSDTDAPFEIDEDWTYPPGWGGIANHYPHQREETADTSAVTATITSAVTPNFYDRQSLAPEHSYSVRSSSVLERERSEVRDTVPDAEFILYTHETVSSAGPRPRRRPADIPREEYIYTCNFPGCTKAYLGLFGLNQHVRRNNHGPDRAFSEFPNRNTNKRQRPTHSEGRDGMGTSSKKRRSRRGGGSAAGGVVA
ncbi:hypothetical protein RUND412_009698 [Rhizina undulata]